jgi:cytoskeleton protein RodZ
MEKSESVGQTLRRGREERGLTIEQAAHQSKVPIRLVEALESDDYHLLPDALYLVRLLHDYATLLRLDAAAIETEFRRAVRRPSRPSLAPPSATRLDPTIPWKQMAWTVVAILVVTPLVFIALSLASKRAQEREAQPPIAAPRAEESRPAGDEAVGGAERFLGSVTPSAFSVGDSTAEAPTPLSGEAGEAPTPIGTDVVAETAPARQVLVVRAHESTWLSVRPDAGERRQVLLQPGQAARFGAEVGFRVTVGNACGVALWFNGASLPSLGRSGEVVRDLILPPPQGGSPASGAEGAPSRQ